VAGLKKEPELFGDHKRSSEKRGTSPTMTSLDPATIGPSSCSSTEQQEATLPLVTASSSSSSLAAAVAAAAAAGDTSSSSSSSTPPAKLDQEQRVAAMDRDTDDEGNDFSAVQVSRIMREQDADLLDSMHYASAKVSQYSPGGTPTLRPKMASPRELHLLSHLPPLDDLTTPLLTAASAALQGLSVSSSSANANANASSLPPTITALKTVGLLMEEASTNTSTNTNSNMRMMLLEDSTSANANPVAASTLFDTINSAAIEKSLAPVVDELGLPPPEETKEERRYRRCLSGEIRAITTITTTNNIIAQSNNSNNNMPPLSLLSLSSHNQQQQQQQHHERKNDDNNNNNDPEEEDVGLDLEALGGQSEQQQQQQQLQEQQETETTASPICVAQETSSNVHAANVSSQAQAARRRVSEAIQFAEAVGEEIKRKEQLELVIIEDGDYDDSDDSDDESCESKQIHISYSPAGSVVVATSVANTANECDSLALALPELELVTSHRNGSDIRKREGLIPQEASSSLPLQEPSFISKEDHPHCHNKYSNVNNNAGVLPKHVDVVHEVESVVIDHGVSQKQQQTRKSRPLWPFSPAGTKYSFLDKLNDGGGLDHDDYVYKGICANPPEITKRGIERGNYAKLHRKAWLEVSDKYHRYGKNLRNYYRYWEQLGFPTNQFFDWLDSKGEAAGQPLPNLEDCPRSVLDADTVLYIPTSEVTEGYALNFVCNEEGRGRVTDVDGEFVRTGSEGWIFVLRDNVMYGAQKITSVSGHSKQRFHHSSFFGGRAVASAGIIITDDDGYLTLLYPHSGHYRPGESHMQRMLFFLYRNGLDLRTVEMDTQQFRHVARDKDVHKGKDAKGEKAEKKAKKVDSLHLEKGVKVACFLAHKAAFIGEGIFDCIHKIRKADVTSVSEALVSVDDGGYWNKNNKDASDGTNNNGGGAVDTKDGASNTNTVVAVSSSGEEPVSNNNNNNAR
jgi:hypothetical protein